MFQNDNRKDNYQCSVISKLAFKMNDLILMTETLQNPSKKAPTDSLVVSITTFTGMLSLQTT